MVASLTGSSRKEASLQAVVAALAPPDVSCRGWNPKWIEAVELLI